MSNLKPNQFRLPSGAVITETGLICQPDMAAAIYQDRKTVTRRMNGLDSVNNLVNHLNLERMQIYPDGSLKAVFEYEGELGSVKSPYGKPGDLLYVRENFNLGSWREDGRMAFDYMASPELTNTHWCKFTDEEDPEGEKFNKLWMNATDQLIAKGIETDEEGNYHWKPGKSPLNWKPSIYMPKAASRLWLMVEEERVERLQDISEEDAIAEGIYKDRAGHYRIYSSDFKSTDRIQLFTKSAKESFQSLWISINGDASWNANPWVWVVRFRVLSKTGRPTDEVIWENYQKLCSFARENIRKEATHV